MSRGDLPTPPVNGHVPGLQAGMNVQSAPEAEGGSPSRLLIPTLLLGVFMGALDLAVVAPALSTIGRDFGVDVRDLSWVFTTYVLAGIASLPLMAKLSDTFGRRPIYVLDVGLFALGSVLAAVAPSYPLFLLARAIQAFGAGGIFPVASAVIGDTYPKRRQGLMFALIGSIWGIASILGPPIGGIIVHQLSWQWIFLINLPLGLFVIWGALQTLPSFRQGRRGPFDIAGLLLLTVALTAVTFGLSRLDGIEPWMGILRWETGLPIAVGLLLLIPWVQVERRASDPIIRLGLLGRRQIALANVLTVLGGSSEAAMLFLPAFASLLLGLDSQAAGFIVAPGALALFFGTPVTGILLDRIGSRAVMVGGGVLAAIGMFLTAFWVHDTMSLIIAIVIGGFGLSALLGTPVRYIVSREAGRAERGIAMALISIATNVGIALSSAITGAIVSSAGADLRAGYSWAYAAVGIAMLGAAALALMLKGRAEELASGDPEAVAGMTMRRRKSAV